MQTKPFTLEAAQAGVRLVIRNHPNSMARFLGTINGGRSIVVATRLGGEYEAETVRTMLPSGESIAIKIDQLPVGELDGKPVFFNDEYEVRVGCSFGWYKRQATVDFFKDDMHSYRWPKQKIKKEVWQAKLKDEAGRPYISSAWLAGSKEDVEVEIGHHSRFVEAVKTGEYEVEEN